MTIQMKSAQSSLTGRKFPPSVYKVFNCIETNGAVTSKEIMQKSGIAKRTMRLAIKILTDEDIIYREPVLGDMRVVRYRLRNN